MRVPWTARRSSLSILKESTLNIHWKADAEAEVLIPRPPDLRKWLIGKDLNAGKDRGHEEKRGSRGLDDWMASLIQLT